MEVGRLPGSGVYCDRLDEETLIDDQLPEIELDAALFQSMC
jgi:hypothetical protein